jgi:hypothetical protein
VKICNAISTGTKVYCTPRNIYIDVAGDTGTDIGVKHDSFVVVRRYPRVLK